MAGFSCHKARLAWPGPKGIAMKSAMLCRALLLGLFAARRHGQAAKPHNIIIFVADGLRYGSVEPATCPTWRG